MAANAAVEREQQIIVERRGRLEAEVELQEAKLRSSKDQALSLQAEAEQRTRDSASAVENFAELEEAKAAVQEVQSQLAAVRQRGAEEADAHQERLDEARGIYQMYAASTGIRWDYGADRASGYVALGTAQHFDFDLDVQRSAHSAEDREQAAVPLAEKLWREVEAALPPPGHARSPWESLDSPAGPGGA